MRSFVEQRHTPLRGQLPDGTGEVFADARQVLEGGFRPGVHRRYRLGQAVDDPRGVAIGPDPVGIGLIEFQEVPDLAKEPGDLGVGNRFPWSGCHESLVSDRPVKGIGSECERAYLPCSEKFQGIPTLPRHRPGFPGPGELPRPANPRAWAQTDTTPPPLSLRLNVAARRLDLFSNGQRLVTYPVAVGMWDYQTPTGSFKVTTVEWRPWWIPPDREWTEGQDTMPPGPDNPMGRVKLYFKHLYFFHGTPDVGSIGTAASHGCVRMRNRDAVALGIRVMVQATKFTPARSVQDDPGHHHHELAPG